MTCRARVQPDSSSISLSSQPRLDDILISTTLARLVPDIVSTEPRLYILEGPLRYLKGPALILGALVSACFPGFGSKDLK